MTPAEIAAWWIKAGFSVFPCAVAEVSAGVWRKRPLTPRGHLDATTSWPKAALMAGWTYANNEHIAVGVVPGSGDGVVLDCDVKHGGVGLATYAALAAEDPDGVGASMWRWSTPSGGLNVLVLKRDVNVRIGNRSPWPSVDVRADSGWIVAPDVDGLFWTWTPPTSEAPTIGESLWAQLSPATLQPSAESNWSWREWLEPGSWDPRSQAAFEKALGRLLRAEPGGRHGAMVDAVGSLVGALWADHEAGYRSLSEAWTRKVANDDPDRAGELGAAMAWAVGREIAKGRPTSRPPTSKVATIEMPSHIDPEDDPWHIVPLSAVDLDAEETMVVDGLIKANTWVQIVAGAKVGKSTLLLHVVHRLCRGLHPWTDEEITPRRVLYLDAEMTRRIQAERVERAGVDRHLLDGLLWYSDCAGRISTEEGAAILAIQLRRLSIDVLVLDGLNGFIAGDENKSDPWLDLYDRAIAPAKSAGLTVISADNTGHGESRRPRGHSIKVDKADMVLVVERSNGGVVLEATHDRHGVLPDRVHLIVGGLGGETDVTYIADDTKAGARPEKTDACLDELRIIAPPRPTSKRLAGKALRAAGAHYSEAAVLAATKIYNHEL